tara:strand:+ start:33637 stop:34308 length:672 start_codon:yes stop_codon:yes gene_type:complete
MSTVKDKKEKLVKAEKAEVTTGQPNNGGFVVSLEDVDIPRLNVIQKMSSIEGPVGGVVIDKSDVLIEKDERVDVIIGHTKKGWRENIPFGSDEMPRMAWSESERAEIESDSEYGKMVVFADITFLVPQPENADDENDIYQYPIGDQNYALGVINVSKDGYKFTYKKLNTFQLFNSTLPISAKVWSFGTELITKGQHSWFVPTLKPTSENAPEEAVTFSQLLGS